MNKIKPDSAAIVFQSNDDMEMLVPDNIDDNNVPNHVYVCAAIFSYLGNHPDAVHKMLNELEQAAERKMKMN